MLLGTALLLLATTAASAQVVLDGSMGPAGPVAPINNDYAVTHDLGQIRGTNLFHSFSDFSIRSGQSATFSGPSGLANVLSRVTGGNPSSIDGTLKSTVPGANFWFVNPTGIFFGPGASINVPASFYAGTADYIGFADGSRFDATNAATTTLTAAAPTAFGFLGAEPAPLRVDGSDLSVADGSELVLVGGNLEISGGSTLGAPEGAVGLQGIGSVGEAALGSQVIEIGDVSGNSTVALSDSKISAQTIVIRGGSIETFDGTELTAETDNMDRGSRIDILARADVELGESTWVRANGSDGGEVNIESETGTTWVAGTVQAKGSDAEGGAVHVLGERVGLGAGALIDVSGQTGGGVALIGGDFKGGNPDIRNAEVTYMDRGATVNADAHGDGDGGTAIVWADHTARVFGELSARGGPEGGDGGLIETSGRAHLDVANIRVDAGAPQGVSGSWLLDPLDVEVVDFLNGDNTIVEDPENVFKPADPGGSQILNTSITSRLDAGTNVTISTEGTQHGDITVSAPIEAYGSATLELLAAGHIDITNNNVLILDGGELVLSGDDVTIVDSQVGTQAVKGAAGNVKVTARGTVEIKSETDVTSISSFSFSEDQGKGDAGTVTVIAERIVVKRASNQFTGIFSETFSTNDAGSVIVKAGDIQVEAGDIRSDTHGDGDAGRVNVKATHIHLMNEAGITSTAQGDPKREKTKGNAGSVTVEVTKHFKSEGREFFGDGAILMDDDSEISSNGGLPENPGQIAGNGGQVYVSAESLELVERISGKNPRIATSGTNKSKGGTIDVKVNGVLSIYGGQITSSAVDGKAGTITVNAGELSIESGGQITSSTTASGNAGAVRVKADTIRIAAGESTECCTGIRASSNPDSNVKHPGNGGSIEIDVAGEIELFGSAEVQDDTARIEAIAFDFYGNGRSGQAGTVTVKAGALTIDHGSISSATEGNGDASKVSIQVVGPPPESQRPGVDYGVLTIRNSGAVESSTVGTGNAGDIQIVANDVVIRDFGMVNSETFGTGNAGNVVVKADTMRIDAAEDEDCCTSISASTHNDLNVKHPGNGGSIEIDVAGEIELFGNAEVQDDTARIEAIAFDFYGNGRSGQAGTVTIVAGALTIDHGSISSATDGDGNASTVSIQIDGPQPGSQRAGVDYGVLTIRNSGRIESNTLGTGSAGNIQIEANDVLLAGEVVSSGEAAPPGEEGVTSEILTSSRLTGGAGSIRIEARNSIRQSGGRISTEVNDGDDSDLLGQIDLLAPEITLSGGTIDANTKGSRAGGDVKIVTGKLTLSDGASIAARSLGTEEDAGEGGGIEIGAGSSFVSRNSTVTTQTTRANGGNINFNVVNLFELEDSAVTTSVADGRGSGGNIFIDPKFVVLRSSRIEANAVEGQGGNIKIVADNYFATPDSVVEANSTRGNDGTIEIDAAGADVVGGLAQLPANFRDPGRLLLTPCAQRVGTGGSRIEVSPLAGLPRSPGQYFFSATAPAQIPFAQDSPTGEETVAVGAFGSDYRLALSPCARRHRIN